VRALPLNIYLSVFYANIVAHYDLQAPMQGFLWPHVVLLVRQQKAANVKQSPSCCDNDV
jgi:hypothetical protein